MEGQKSEQVDGVVRKQTHIRWYCLAILMRLTDLLVTDRVIKPNGHIVTYSLWRDFSTLSNIIIFPVHFRTSYQIIVLEYETYTYGVQSNESFIRIHLCNVLGCF